MVVGDPYRHLYFLPRATFLYRSESVKISCTTRPQIVSHGHQGGVSQHPRSAELSRISTIHSSLEPSAFVNRHLIGTVILASATRAGLLIHQRVADKVKKNCDGKNPTTMKITIPPRDGDTSDGTDPLPSPRSRTRFLPGEVYPLV